VGLPVYFDSSVFLSIFTGDPSAASIKELLQELKKDHIKIYTSIITITEVSVLSYRKGTMAEDNYAKVFKLSRIEGVTKEIALTAAKFEAHILDQTAAPDQADNKRRRWDCMHIATALELGCSTLYSCDLKMLKRKNQFSIAKMDFREPKPSAPSLFPRDPAATPPIQ
jgi:predicted nucleic acid-binding protein